jgi:hypothetical protein
MGISLVVAPDRQLLSEVQRDSDEKKKISQNNGKEYAEPETIVIAGKASVNSREFRAFKEKEKAFLVGVDGSELSAKSYVRVMDIITLAFNLRYSSILTANPNNHPNIGLYKENGIFVLIPRATPFFSYEELNALYKVQKSV